MNKTRNKKPAHKESEIVASHNGSRLAEWSRRKAAARSRASTPAGEDIIDREAHSLKDAVPTTEEVKESEQALRDADMPPLETLDEHSDYSGFLSPGVSEKLRKRALRKLFHLDAYNLTDGLDDYAEDYTNFAALGDILTSDLRLRKQREADALKEQLLNTGESQEKSPDVSIEEQEETDSINGPVSETIQAAIPEEDSTENRNEDQA